MALVTVLWVITLLAVIAASMSLGMRRDAGILFNAQQATQARWLAEGGVHHAMLMLSHSDPELRWEADGAVHGIALGQGLVRVRVMDAGGAIDLNQARPELLDGLLLHLGIDDPRERERIVDNILDWRDASSERRLHGDGETGYAASARPYGPRNDHFPAKEELALVLGITPELYRRAAPLVTVHSRRSGVVPSSAPRGVLMALPEVDEATLEQFLAERDRASELGMPAPAFPLASPHLAEASGLAYTIESYAVLPSGHGSGLRVEIVQSGDVFSGPYSILSYRDLDSPPPVLASGGGGRE